MLILYHFISVRIKPSQ